MSTATQTRTSPSVTSSSGVLAQWSSRLSVPSIIVIAVVAAVAVNLAIWAVAAIAGGSFEFTDGDTIESAAPAGVVLLTAVPLAVGLVLAALVAVRWIVLVRVAQVVAPVLALATIGLTLAADFDTASTIALSLAHVTLVPVLLVSLEMIRLRAADRTSTRR